MVLFLARSSYVRRLLLGICNTAQRRIVSNKPFAKKYGGASGIGIMVVGASYAVLGGAVLVFLSSVKIIGGNGRHVLVLVTKDRNTLIEQTLSHIYVFLKQQSYTLWKSKRQSFITPSSDIGAVDTNTGGHNTDTEVAPPANTVKEN